MTFTEASWATNSDFSMFNKYADGVTKEQMAAIMQMAENTEVLIGVVVQHTTFKREARSFSSSYLPNPHITLFIDEPSASFFQKHTNPVKLDLGFNVDEELMPAVGSFSLVGQRVAVVIKSFIKRVVQVNIIRPFPLMQINDITNWAPGRMIKHTYKTVNGKTLAFNTDSRLATAIAVKDDVVTLFWHEHSTKKRALTWHEHVTMHHVFAFPHKDVEFVDV